MPCPGRNTPSDLYMELAGQDRDKAKRLCRVHEEKAELTQCSAYESAREHLTAILEGEIISSPDDEEY